LILNNAVLEAKDLVLKKITEGTNTRYLLLDRSDGVFAINELLYDILTLCQQTTDHSVITEQLNTKHRISYVDSFFIDKALDSTFQKVDLRKKQATQNDFIGYKISIIKEGKFQIIFKSLSVLFQRYLFLFLTIISLLSSVFFITDNHLFTLASIYQRTRYDLSLINIIIVYVLMAAVIIFHELGHASASYYYRIPPKEIGFGFYFIFPVFFSNVTSIWQLSSGKRNVVNFGGIYFQLIVNIVLIVLYYLNFARPVIFTLIITNNASMIGSANPFFRFDGYWIFSDSFNLPNLKYKVRKLFTTLIVTQQSRLEYLRQQSKSLIMYAFLNLAFWIFVYFSVIHFSINNSVRLYKIIVNESFEKSFVLTRDTIFSTALMIGMLYLLTIHLLQTVKIVKNETN
jgi:putative peptide zinc metalloprotease protein